MSLQISFFLTIFIMIGFIFTIAYKTPYDYDFTRFWIENTITSISVGSFSALFGYYAYQKFYANSFIRILSLGILISLIGGVIGRIVSLFLQHYLQGRIIIFDSSLFISSLSTLFITFLIASFSITIWYLQDRQITSNINSKRENIFIDERNFSYKKEGKIYLIPLNEIVYLTANRKKTILHTKSSDIEINELLKAVLLRLPSNKFFRVHKKYSINLDFAGSIEHLSSGDYQVFLWKENFIVPVSAKNQKELRRKLNLI